MTVRMHKSGENLTQTPNRDVKNADFEHVALIMHTHLHTAAGKCGDSGRHYAGAEVPG